MNIEIYDEIKRAIKDAISEWYKENKLSIQEVYSINENEEKLLTVKQFCTKHNFIKEGGLRNRLKCRDYNKFSGCVSIVGRRVLIKEKEALQWFSNPPPEANWTYDKNKYST